MKVMMVDIEQVKLIKLEPINSYLLSINAQGPSNY